MNFLFLSFLLFSASRPNTLFLSGRRRKQTEGFQRRPPPANTTVLKVGERGLADVVVEVPYDISHEMLRLGDPALLIVVSNSPSLNSFKAVRDVFLPATRQWLYEYPFVSRGGFKQIVDRVNYMKSQSNSYSTGAGQSTF